MTPALIGLIGAAVVVAGLYALWRWARRDDYEYEDSGYAYYEEEEYWEEHWEEEEWEERD
jgi:hypothetical protein